MKTSKASIVQVSIHAKSAVASWPRDRSWTTEVLWQGLHLGVLILAVLIGWLVSQDTSSRVESFRGESYRAQPFESDRIENDPIEDARAFRYIAFGGQTTEDPVPQSSCDCDGTGETNSSRLSLNPYSSLDSSLSEVWELSSRHLPEKFRCIDSQSPGLEALRRTETGWQRDDLEGLSLSPQLKDASTKRERPAITSHNQGNHGVRSEKWRYIVYADGSEELYDMVNDPNEWTNVDGKPVNDAIIAEHKNWLP